MARPEDGSIVLIGPSGSGKTSAGRLLAESLGWEYVDLDDLRSTYYPEFGIDREAERAAHDRGGLAGLLEYWKPFELRSVERVMREFPARTVIAFGGGQSVYTDGEDIRRAGQALSMALRVVLLMPDVDPERAIHILIDRIGRDPEVQADIDQIEPFLAEFRPIVASQVTSESNRFLATDTVVTGTDRPEDVARRIFALVRPTS